MIKVCLALAFALVSLTARADNPPSQPGPDAAKYAAEFNIASYILVRVGGLNNGQMSQGLICGLAGRTQASFEILGAFGLSDSQIDAVFVGFEKQGMTMATVRAQLAKDLADCSK